ncbi:hypothetical protein EVAR_29188_1 [Eumeta japonica]|uniref:Uncharacterized protein n=1 Tax=Eumeta variegata TaxID=151549 RepID=A0A4C1VCR1_EUMVA|nr:hypothetical protein EVAR_29188_1 [Eumeta japonica]
MEHSSAAVLQQANPNTGERPHTKETSVENDPYIYLSSLRIHSRGGAGAVAAGSPLARVRLPFDAAQLGVGLPRQQLDVFAVPHLDEFLPFTVKPLNKTAQTHAVALRSDGGNRDYLIRPSRRSNSYYLDGRAHAEVCCTMPVFGARAGFPGIIRLGFSPEEGGTGSRVGVL